MSRCSMMLIGTDFQQQYRVSSPLLRVTVDYNDAFDSKMTGGPPLIEDINLPY